MALSTKRQTDSNNGKKSKRSQKESDSTALKIDATKSEFEKIPCQIFDHASHTAIAVAHHIADTIRQRQKENKNCVLGLATGSTPVGVYNELVRLHQADELSLANVITFNLDEYYPMQPEELQSYVRFMKEHLFDHVDIPPENLSLIHI